MVRSLLIKLAMLAVTLGTLVWIGSVTPVRQVTPPPVQPAAAAQFPSVSRSTTGKKSPAFNPPFSAVGTPPEIASHSTSPSVKSLESLPSSDTSEVGRPDPLRRVDLNRATAADLEILPGIGPTLAQRVIEHRASHGPFRKVEDLRQVKGIGSKKFDRLRSQVLVTHVKASSHQKGPL